MTGQTVVAGVPGYDPREVPLYRDRETVERKYSEAEQTREPFFAVESYEEGYAVTYDLLPAGKQLAPPAASEVGERLTREVEEVVGDERLPTTEVSKSVSASLGNVSFFQREESARRVAAVISTLVLDEANWVDADVPNQAGTRRN
jgi:RNase H-fold protein (predicted Holliday junction resolvase)